jgi:hypothetical protein
MRTSMEEMRALAGITRDEPMQGPASPERALVRPTQEGVDDAYNPYEEVKAQIQRLGALDQTAVKQLLDELLDGRDRLEAAMKWNKGEIPLKVLGATDKLVKQSHKTIDALENFRTALITLTRAQ